LIISDALNLAQKITSLQSDTPSLDAQVLLAHILEKPRSWVLAHPEADLSSEQQAALSQTLSQLETGTPLPYVIGHWEFYGLEFTVSPAVLIPRPETELLIEEALTWLRAHPNCRSAADIGTGSGCIAVTLAKHINNLKVIGTDISEKALEIAGTNANMHGVANQIKFDQSDLFSQLSTIHSSLNLICANLPYIPTTTLHSLKVYGREPTLALDGGPDGLNTIRELLKQAPQHLAPTGLLLLEIDASQGIAALCLAQEAFPDANVELLPDLAGHDRLIRVET